MKRQAKSSQTGIRQIFDEVCSSSSLAENFWFSNHWIFPSKMQKENPAFITNIFGWIWRNNSFINIFNNKWWAFFFMVWSKENKVRRLEFSCIQNFHNLFLKLTKFFLMQHSKQLPECFIKILWFLFGFMVTWYLLFMHWWATNQRIFIVQYFDFLETTLV